MAWGIFIGIVLTILTVVLSLLFGKKGLTPLSYIVAAIALIVFCFKGVSCVHAIGDKKNVTNNVNNITAIVETAISYTGSDVQNYQLGIAEATTARTALRFVYPKAAKYIEPSDLTGKTVYECTEVLRESVIRSASIRIWKSVCWMVGILIIATLLIVATTNIGNGVHNHSSAPSGNDDVYHPSSADDF